MYLKCQFLSMQVDQFFFLLFFYRYYYFLMDFLRILNLFALAMVSFKTKEILDQLAAEVGCALKKL